MLENAPTLAIVAVHSAENDPNILIINDLFFSVLFIRSPETSRGALKAGPIREGFWYVPLRKVVEYCIFRAAREHNKLPPERILSTKSTPTGGDIKMDHAKLQTYSFCQINMKLSRNFTN